MRVRVRAAGGALLREGLRRHELDKVRVARRRGEPLPRAG